MNPELRKLFKDGDPDPAALDTFLAEHSFPIVEGNRATFVWRGHAEGVNLRHWIFGLESAQPLHRAPEQVLAFNLEGGFRQHRFNDALKEPPALQNLDF